MFFSFPGGYARLMFWTTLISASAWSQTVNVTTYGALSNGTNSSATTAAFRSAFAAAGSLGKVIVPPGTYAIDNSGGPVTFDNFQGEFKFEGNATLAFNTNSHSGMLFRSGSGLRVIGFQSTYSNPPTSATANLAALTISGTTNTFVDDVKVQQSPGLGISFTSAQSPKVSNAVVMNSQGPGIVFSNSPNAELVNATVTDSGGDGIVFQTTSGVTGMDGAHAANLTTTSAGGHGLAVSGESYVTINGFTTYSAGSSGIYCGSASGTASPNRVLFEGGLIENPSGYGIEINNAQSCSFANIQVIGANNRGVSGSGSGATIDMRNIRVTGNTAGDAFNFTGVNTVRISDSAVENSPGYGFFFDNVQTAMATSLTTTDVSTENSLHRAIWFQNGNSAVAFDLTVIDDQSSATGYIVGSNGIVSGALHSIASIISGGTLSVQNQSPGVNVTSVN